LKHFADALKRELKNIDYLKHAGMTYFAVNNLKKSEGVLSEVIGLDPKNIDAHYHLGLIHFRGDKLNQAIQSFQKVLDRNKQHTRARYWKARALEAVGQPRQLKAARGEYDMVSAALKKDPKLETELCDAYWRRGLMQSQRFAEWNDADVELTRFLKCSPQSSSAWLARGDLRANLGKLDAAINDFKKAAKLKPKMGLAYAKNAETQMRKPKYNEKNVQALLQRAVRFEPKLARPHYVLCNMIKERNPAQARRHCRTYLKLAPKGDNADEAQLLLRSL
jgi:tetratricopeptide (TPR) repeat protein